MNNKIGILLTSHPGHSLFLKLCLDCFTPLTDKYEVLLGWDDDAFRWHHPLPESIHLLLTGVPRPETFGARLHLGEQYQMLHGSEMLINLGCDYILKLGGDQIVNKPEKIPELIPWLDDADILTNEGMGPGWLCTNHFFVRAKEFFNAAKNGDYIHHGYTEALYNEMITRGLLKWKRIGTRDIELFLDWRHLQSEYNHATNQFYEASWAAGNVARDMTIEELDTLIKR